MSAQRVSAVEVLNVEPQVGLGVETRQRHSPKEAVTVEVRRRTWLVATIAVLAALVAVGYLARFAAVGGWVSLAIGGGMAGFAVLYGVAWSRARTPLVIADATGLRVSLGTMWAGVPWDDVERVEVRTAGRVRDGCLSVLPADEAAVLVGAGRRSRLEAAWNRRVYGSALAVPYGWATTVSTDDLSDQLRVLAEGRAQVAVREHSTPDGTPADATKGDAHRCDPAGPKPLVALPLQRSVTPGGAPAARREDVTIAARRGAVDGTLALSEPSEEVRTEELPEISRLRRGTPAATGRANGDVALGVGNVELIIDATTDLSARAMQRVRRLDGSSAGDATMRQAVADAPSPSPLYIGDDLRRARENLGLTVDDLAERTRIRPVVIECMETDDFAACGGDFYARGHLRMLARVLGIASDPLITTYDEEFATSPVSLRDAFDVEMPTGATGIVRGGTGSTNWVGLVAAVVILLVIWGFARYFTDTNSTDAAPTGGQSSHPSAARAGSGGGRAGPEVSRRDAGVTLSATGGTSYVVVRDGSGDVVWQGLLQTGGTKKVSGTAPLTVAAADGGVVSLKVKGKVLGRVGKSGEHAIRKVPTTPPGG